MIWTAGVLFRHVDAFVVHGGLGTTVEALRMKKPVAVTGTLLMDQRFWGGARDLAEIYPRYSRDTADSSDRVSHALSGGCVRPTISAIISHDLGDDRPDGRAVLRCVRG